MQIFHPLRYLYASRLARATATRASRVCGPCYALGVPLCTNRISEDFEDTIEKLIELIIRMTELLQEKR